ncbi:DUF2079 domain-containing protein [Hyalangium rubrum]|uniref:DUF2079 domain-containing protein n=1 Tax=Hyalangium rubrum TaxID=3103134 RepID=A0ABU5HAU5_9BACT|nr:DUF2079 domain-containing protein [Hyalangium sp. s54d21]MDY7230242.1 DUF2079 domain-containing protein [Hyalangium sp. s54d21]
MLRSPQRLYILYTLALSGVLLLMAPLSWLHKELGAPRNWQTLLNVLLVLALAWAGGLREGTSEATLPARVKRLFVIAVAVYCVSVQLGRYFSFAINGVDFSIFDWMLYNTNHRDFGYSPIYDVNHFGVHATYVLFPLVVLHRLFETPLLLCLTTAALVGGAAWPLWRLGKRVLPHEGLCVLLVLAYLTTPFTSVLLDGGFRPEVCYPLFGLTFLLGWVERRPALWGAALVAFLGIKEDAAFYVIAFALGVFLFERARWRPALGMLVAAAALFVFNVRFFQPLMLQGSNYAQPTYVTFWGQYGATLPEIVRNMLTSPLRLLGDVLTSGWYRVFAPALFLPLLSSRALVPMLATVFLLGSTSYAKMRGFGTYYPVTLLPFFFWGFTEAYAVLGRHPWLARLREGLLVVALLLFPLVGGNYAKFSRPPSEVRQALPSVRERLAREPGPICAQTVFFPHLPYELPLRPLFEDCWEHPEWSKLAHPELEPYPFTRAAFQRHLEEARRQGRTEELGAGFVLIDPGARGPSTSVDTSR